MSDLISRQAAIDAIMGEPTDAHYPSWYAERLEQLPSAQGKPFNLPEIYIADGYDTIEGEDGNVGFGVYVPDENKIYVAGDVEGEIRARALLHEICHWVQAMCGRSFDEDEANEFSDIVYDALPSAQETHEERTETHACDLISRQAAIKYLMTNMNWYDEDGYESDDDYKRECITELINGVPSAQPYTEAELQKIQELEQAELEKAFELGKAEANKWIPCDKGEPDEDTECWVTVKTTDALYRGNFTKRYGERRDKGFVTSDGFMWWNTALAWMPIYEPEPYNAGSEES